MWPLFWACESGLEVHLAPIPTAQRFSAPAELFCTVLRLQKIFYADTLHSVTCTKNVPWLLGKNCQPEVIGSSKKTLYFDRIKINGILQND